MNLQPPGGSALDAVDPSALLYAIGGVALFSVLMTVTRSMALRCVWWVGRLACALYPALLAWQWWSFDDSTGTLTAGSTAATDAQAWLRPDLPDLPQLSPLQWNPRPPTDTEISLLVVAVGLVAFFLLNLQLARTRSVGR
jgi:hypothetical protein